MKMIYPFFFLCAFFISMQSSSQTFIPCKCDETKKFGYCDSLTGKKKVDCKFDSAYKFVKGLARVFINGKYGFINNQGVLKIAAEYDLAADFSESFAAVKKDSKYFFIDQNNSNPFGKNYFFANPKTLAAMTKQQLKQFGDPLSSFRQGLAVVYDSSGLAGFINTKGAFSIVPKYLIATSFGDGMAMVMEKSTEPVKTIDKTGKVMFELPKGWVPAESFTNGTAIVQTRINRNNEYNVIDAKGKLIFAGNLYEIERFNTKYFQIYKKYGQSGIATMDGRLIIDPDTSKIFSIMNELDRAGNYTAYLYDDKASNKLGKMILLNKDLKRITYHSYTHIMGYEDGFYQPYQRQGSDLFFGLLSKEGKELLPTNYQLIRYNVTEKLIWVKNKEDKEGLYDYSLKPLLTEEFTMIEGWKEEDKTKILVLAKDRKQGLSNKSGKMLTTLDYSSIQFMDYGVNSFYATKRDEKDGVIDMTGKEIIAPVYTNLYPEFEEGCPFFSAGKEGKHGWVDKNGKIILPFIYAEPVACPGKDILTPGKLSDSGYVYINKAGQVLAGKKFQYASFFQNGVAYVKEKNKFGFIDVTGKYLHQPVYDDIATIYDEENQPALYAVEKEGKTAVMDKALKLITPIHFDKLNVDEDEYFVLSEGMIKVKQNGKWGFIDKTGKLIIPCTYDSVGSFTDGVAEVMIKEETFKINKKGERLK